MITSFYVCYDRDMKVFDAPFTAPIQKTDIKEAYRRQFYHEPQKAFDSHLDRKDLYFLGTFDDEKGEFTQNKDFLFEIREILPPLQPKPVDEINAKLELLLKRSETKYGN